MIRDILRKTLKQRKKRDIFFTVWSWIYANTNDKFIYYGNMKDICQNTKAKYAEINQAFKMQQQWNTKLHEKTIIFRKDGNAFKPIHNNYIAEKYFKLFEINTSEFTSAYKPLIIVFNSLTYEQMAETNPEANKMQISLELNVESLAPKIESPEPEKKEKKKPEVDIKKQIEKKLINECMDIYIEFCKQKLDVEPNFNYSKDDKKAKGEVGAEINALKTMIAFFRKNNKQVEQSESGIINSFDMILRNWDKYPQYYQAKFKLREINSNLLSLIKYIKDNQTVMDTSKSAKALKFATEMDAFVKAGGLNEQLQNLEQPPY